MRLERWPSDARAARGALLGARRDEGEPRVEERSQLRVRELVGAEATVKARVGQLVASEHLPKRERVGARTRRERRARTPVAEGMDAPRLPLLTLDRIYSEFFCTYSRTMIS